MTMFMWPMKDATCRGVRPDSVVASIDAPYLSSSSTTLMRFFLQAMCSGVKPFCGSGERGGLETWVHSEHVLLSRGHSRVKQ